MKNRPEYISEINNLASEGKSFVFIIDFKATGCQIFPIETPNDKLFWQIGKKNETEIQELTIKSWKTNPVGLTNYQKGFEIIRKHILNGDTYLLNYTQPTGVETTYSLDEIYRISNAPYKIYLKNKFVCFSPETFIQIRNGKIYSFPMKGTIDAGIKNAKKILRNDLKEIAEHCTIVDLIRNDLSLVAENVKVEKFRFLNRIETNHSNLWQVSSRISGRLPNDYLKRLGEIIYTLLPAGSISGAPKKKTLEIIEKAEGYERGFYTGIFGYFDGKDLDSCVLIRFLEKTGDKLVYKSGGGITFMSEAAKEYDELLKKVYVPIA